MTVRSETYQLLTVEEASQALRVPVGTLRHWRLHGKGPKAARIGKRIMYRRSDLDAFVDDLFAQDVR